MVSVETDKFPTRAHLRGTQAVGLLLCYALIATTPVATTAGGHEEFAPIVSGLPPGFVFGTATAAYQAGILLMLS